ncbi:AGE family epimerase/isomerase [Halalkalicoccus sp. NIPERK01]|uniref:AGE family epimerase/isomerase n=1 Tax=Halalkalicoccus sp. NIPERK01 TaxID=3053469 RepID=UPI0026E57DB8|nr:AGE family epimerase/isomerase [Halalkalicoccus sp. NIPERK01]
MNVYRAREGLRHAFRDVLNFYYPDCIDVRTGGYAAQIDERDGSVYDPRSKHLVATARAINNFSLGVLADGPEWCRPSAEHGLRFLSTVHWDGEQEGYDWLLDGRDPVDRTRYCYGHAFALLAGARAHQAGISGGREELDRAFSVLEERFFEPEHRLYADRASADWSELSPYRGANANMHALEALLAAGEATGEERFFERAYDVAERFARALASETGGLLWEHYSESWEHDLSHNADEPDHQFRPPGYQPSHHAEWAKLLCLLAEYRDEEWLLTRAMELFDAAIHLGWDEEHEGLYYTVEESGEPIVDGKYGWAHAEAIGASALLSRHDPSYLRWYDRLWEYSTTHLINPRYGNWYERVTREGERPEPDHGPEVEPGYHPLTNCWLALEALDRDPSAFCSRE